MSVIGKCPTCGWAIYDGHVTHVCPSAPVVVEMPGYTVSMEFGPYDFIFIPRASLADGADAPNPDPEQT